MSSRFTAVLLVLCAALGIAIVACNGGSSEPVVPTSTPYYTGTDVFPTSVPGNEVPTPENLPVPTLTAEPTVTASGLQIFDTQVGTGAEAQADGIVYVNYTIWVQGGNEVDRNRLATVRYHLSKGRVLDGLVEGIPGMKVGGKRRLIIPPALAYGSSGSGNVIPPNATLIYDIELTDAHPPEGVTPSAATPTLTSATPPVISPTSTVAAPSEKTPTAAPSPAPTSGPLPSAGQGPQSGSSAWHLLAALAAVGATLLAFGAALHRQRTD